MLVAGDGVTRFQAAMVTDAEILQIKTQLGWTAPMADAALPATPTDAGDLPQLAAKLAPWWAEHGGEWGAKTKAVRLLFGEDAKLEGHEARRLDAVLRYIEKSSATPPDRPGGRKIIPFPGRQ